MPAISVLPVSAATENLVALPAPTTLNRPFIVVAPSTSAVPLITVLPVADATVNLASLTLLIAKSPLPVNVPSVNVLPVADATVNLASSTLLIAKLPLPVNNLSNVASSSTVNLPSFAIFILSAAGPVSVADV